LPTGGAAERFQTSSLLRRWEDGLRSRTTQEASARSGSYGSAGREWGEEREAEAEELGAAGELGAQEELPLFLPTSPFMAPADED